MYNTKYIIKCTHTLAHFSHTHSNMKRIDDLTRVHKPWRWDSCCGGQSFYVPAHQTKVQESKIRIF